MKIRLGAMHELYDPVASDHADQPTASTGRYVREYVATDHR